MNRTPENHESGHRGRPGKYPGSPKTVRIRVPQGYEAYVEWCITELPSILHDYNSACKTTRDWTAFIRLMATIHRSQRSWKNEMLIDGYPGVFHDHPTLSMGGVFLVDDSEQVN